MEGSRKNPGQSCTFVSVLGIKFAFSIFSGLACRPKLKSRALLGVNRNQTHGHIYETKESVVVEVSTWPYLSVLAHHWVSGTEQWTMKLRVCGRQKRAPRGRSMSWNLGLPPQDGRDFASVGLRIHSWWRGVILEYSGEVNISTEVLTVTTPF